MDVWVSFTPLGQMYGAIGPSLDIGDLLVGMVDNVGSTLFYVLTVSSFLRIDRKAAVTWDRTRESFFCLLRLLGNSATALDCIMLTPLTWVSSSWRWRRSMVAKASLSSEFLFSMSSCILFNLQRPINSRLGRYLTYFFYSILQKRALS